jgi:hypothetical protein
MADRKCQKCGGQLEAGFTTATGLIGGDGIEAGKPRLVFVVPGPRPSWNPVKAFQQGLAGSHGDQVHGITGFRCQQCGALELYAPAEAE